MLKPVLTLAAALLLLASQIAGADEASVRKAFMAKFPKAQVQSVTKLSYLGLYEIIVEGEVLYADENLDYLIDGNVISTKTMTNLTEQRKRKLAAIPFAELPLELAFKRVKGNGERKLAVFSDPDCPFCRRVENDLAKLDNVTIYMFLFPIDSLHPKATDIAKRVWCSQDRLKAWDDYMQRGIEPGAGNSCQNPVDKIVEYGRKKGINATPTLVFESGERVPGAIPAAQIETYLSGKN